MADEKCSPVEMVHRAMQELGAAADTELAAFVQERFGVRIDARFIPILKASVREREVIERARQAARELAERLQAEQQAKPRKKSRREQDRPATPDTKFRNSADGGAGPQTT